MDTLFLPLRDVRKQWLSQNCSQSESGEYYPIGSWSGELILLDCPDPSLRMVVHGHASPLFRKRGYRFAIRLRCGSENMEVESGQRGSLKAIASHAGATDYAESVGRFLRRIYSHENATCVFRKVGDAWEPFATNLHGWGWCWEQFAPGEYLHVAHNFWRGNRIGGTFYRLWGGGYSGQNDAPWEELARTLPHWLAEPQKEAA